MFPDVRNNIVSPSQVKRAAMRAWSERYMRLFPEDSPWELTRYEWVYWLHCCNTVRLAVGWFDFGLQAEFPPVPLPRAPPTPPTEEYDEMDTQEY